MRWIEAVIVVLTGTIGVCYFIEIFLLPQTTLVNRRFGLFVAENFRSAFRAFTERVFASQSRECCEAMLLREAKTPFYARVEARSSDNGQECRAMVVDITERKRSEKKIQEQANLLERIGFP